MIELCYMLLWIILLTWLITYYEIRWTIGRHRWWSVVLVNVSMHEDSLVCVHEINLTNY